MIKVAILGHSLIRQFTPGNRLYPYYSHNESLAPTNYSLDFFCSPGATFSSILNTKTIDDLTNSSPDLIILVLGGNDLTFSTSIKSVYDDLTNLVNYLKDSCSPTFGIHILEPEIRRGDSRFVSPEIYRTLRNSLIRKIKAKRHISFLPLVKYGFNLKSLSSDGVHFTFDAYKKLFSVLLSHISSILKN